MLTDLDTNTRIRLAQKVKETTAFDLQKRQRAINQVSHQSTPSLYCLEKDRLAHLIDKLIGSILMLEER